MKKIRIDKQTRWALKQHEKRSRSFGMKMMALLLLFFLTMSAGMYAEGSITLKDIGKTAAPVSTATIMGAIGNIERVSNKQRTGKAVKDKLFLLSADQVDESTTFPTRNGIELANIPLKAGEYWHYIRSIIDSPEIKTAGEDGDNAIGIKNTITFVVGGLPDKLLKLIEDGLGEAFYVGFERCSTGEKYLIGSGCKPVKMMPHEGGFTKDFTGITLTFENNDGITFSKYLGNFTTQLPDTVAADATTITLTDNDTYQLSDGSAAVVTITSFAAVTDSDVNRIVTLLGVNGIATYPPNIVAGNDFLLIDGAEWSAIAGATISFQIFKDGATGYKFIEVAGSRA